MYIHQNRSMELIFSQIWTYMSYWVIIDTVGQGWPHRTTGTHLYMLTSLDQFPHKWLQLVIPLDQITQVGIQGLLLQKHRQTKSKQ